MIPFDEALLNACGSQARAQAMTEAAMLADAFVPDGQTDAIEALAATLAVGARDAEMDRAHAMRLACALRCLARHLQG